MIIHDIILAKLFYIGTYVHFLYTTSALKETVNTDPSFNTQ